MTIQPIYSHGPIPESNIDPKIARDTELTWANLQGKPNTYPPIDHDHLHENENGISAEPWLNTLITQAVDTRSPIIHSHIPHRGPVSFRYPNGLGANTPILFFSAGSLAMRKTYAIKLLVEAGSLWPYSGSGALVLTTTGCNGASLNYSLPLLLHNGIGSTAIIRLSGGVQTSPALEVILPFALPASPSSSISVSGLELF